MRIWFKTTLLVLLIVSCWANVNTVQLTTADGDISFIWVKTLPGRVSDVLPYYSPNSPPTVIVSTWSPLLTALDLATGEIVWENREISPPEGLGKHKHAAIADVNGDGKLEVVTVGYVYDRKEDVAKVFSNGSIFVVEAETGEFLWQQYAGWTVGKVTTGNFGGMTGEGILTVRDEIRNISLGTTYAVLGLFDGVTGEEVWNRSYKELDVSVHSFATIDLTGDGYDEIIAGLWVDYPFNLLGLEVFDGVTRSLLWNSTNLFDTVLDMQFYDVTDDRVPDIICTSWTGLFAVDGSDGSLIWEQPELGSYRSYIADLDGDGDQEVVSFDFEEFAVVDARTGEPELIKELPFSVDCISIQVADLDGDGSLEIVTGVFFSDVYIFNATGDLIGGFDTSGPAYSLVLADANGNGLLDIIAGTAVDKAYLYAYQYASSSSSGSNSGLFGLGPSSNATGIVLFSMVVAFTLVVVVRRTVDKKREKRSTLSTYLH